MIIIMDTCFYYSQEDVKPDNNENNDNNNDNADNNDNKDNNDDNKDGKDDDNRDIGWVDDRERSMQDNMMAMCRELEVAWRCVEASLDGMKQNKKKKLYTLLMHGIKRAVEEKCKRKSENISDMSCDTKNLVFGVSNQVGHKQAYAVSAEGLNHEILGTSIGGIVLNM